ncbi:hypothetical protein BDR05DRAFT_947542 [Suillus weaverae]|nr:hypothetical protein BDR05DRAFT_947542 [Suillus weaverae]
MRCWQKKASEHARGAALVDTIDTEPPEITSLPRRATACSPSTGTISVTMRHTRNAPRISPRVRPSSRAPSPDSVLVKFDWFSSSSVCGTQTRPYFGSNTFSIPEVDRHLQVEMTLNCVKPRRDLPIRLSFDVDVLDSNVGPTLRTPCLFEWDGVSRLAFGDLVRDEKSPVFEECSSPRRTDDVFLHKFIAKMSSQGPALCTAALQDTTYICKAIHEIGLVALGLIKRGVVWVAKISSMQFRMAILSLSVTSGEHIHEEHT